MTTISERTRKILGGVVVRDTKVMMQIAAKKDRDVTPIEREGCLNRARNYGVEAQVLALLDD